MWYDHLDEVINSFASFDEQNNSLRGFEVLAKIFDAVEALDLSALCFVFKKVVDLAHCSVENSDLEFMVVHVQNQVLAYNSQSIFPLFCKQV